LALGDRLVREFGLEDSTDTAGRWMAHHLAELLDQSRTLKGVRQKQAEKAATDLILRLWSSREALPGAAYPLKALGKPLSVLRLLGEESSPFSAWRSRTEEALLTDAFDGLRKLVAHGVLLLSGRLDEQPEDDVTTPFLLDEERRAVEAVNRWLAHFKKARRPDVSITDFSSVALSAQPDAEPEVLTEEARAKHAFIEEIEKLQTTLSKLKDKLESGA
jgi:DNA-directed RNA polymerase specialized sigma24 family protein